MPLMSHHSYSPTSVHSFHLITYIKSISIALQQPNSLTIIKLNQKYNNISHPSMDRPPNRYQNLIKHKQKLDLINPRRKFQLDRIIQEYQADSFKEDPLRSIDKGRPVFSLNRSIKIEKLAAEPPTSKFKKLSLGKAAELYASNHELSTQVKLKTLSNRYNRVLTEHKRQAQSTDFQANHSLTPNHKQIFENLRLRAKTKHTSLAVLDQSKSSSLTKPVHKLEKMLRWGHRTRKGYNPNDPHKPNQDEYLVKHYKNSNRYLFAVADGHGANGHLISQFAANRLETHISQETSDNMVLGFSRAYNKIQDQLFKTNIFDATLSGTTLISIMITFPKLICANVGDSRAILVRKLDKFNWEVVHISEDHKPSLPKERKRILKKGGKIHAYKDEQGFSVGPERVWLAHKNAPGLAMSRSLGDNLSKSIGVTHQPQVIQLDIQPEDKFVIVGSDGVWESISTAQILNFLVPLFNQGKLEQCCDTLLQLCLSSSLKKPLDPIDDLTFIVIFLNKPE